MKSSGKRWDDYIKQTGRNFLTPKQRRRSHKKFRHGMATGKYVA